VTNGCEVITESGEVRVSSSNQTIDETAAGNFNISPGTYVALQVRDTGTGISERDKEHIFDPFYTRKTMGRSGTGLGLSVVWNTIKDHRGGVVVESSEKGTMIQLLFPATFDLKRESARANHIVDLKGKKEKILVVDDNPFQRDMAARVLEVLNYCPALAVSGEEALVSFGKDSADLVILDMLMEPGMSGAETVLRMRQVNPLQKAIIVSGFSKEEEVEKAKASGVDIFLKKPYTIEQIGIALKTALGK
jgi:CheY-like chemotaxis protein